MNLLERYLQAIGQYLPAETKADTLAELRANLLAEMDDRAEVLGRPLVESDIVAILKAHGKPEVVALRYLPQRSLIGPTVFPFYALMMRRVLPLVVVVSFFVEALRFATSSRMNWAHALGDFALGIWPSLLITAAVLTAIFAAIEFAVGRGMCKCLWLEWDPAKLPAVKSSGGVPVPLISLRSKVKRLIDLSVHCLWFAYVLWVPWHPFWIMGPGVYYFDKLNVGLAPIWHTFYTLLIVLLSIQLVMKLLVFLPALEGKMKGMKLASDLLGLVAIGVLAWHSVYFVPLNAAADAGKLVDVNHAINMAFRIVLVISVFGLAQQVWKYVKGSTPMRQWAF